MVETTFTHYIAINNPTVAPGTGGAISWNSATALNILTDVTDSAGDGLDEGVDFLSSSSFPYTGRTIEFEGQTYAIFGHLTASQLFIPYNPAPAADGTGGIDLAPLAAGAGASTGYTPSGAQVFNCFATGTTILTPDGEKAIETLRPGDRVMTHDGRSTPVIWVARQTVANPRFVELGRKPVRIDAGALGPNLPNRPLTVTADHALLFGDMLVNAGTLAEDGTPVRFLPLEEMPTSFVWWHVELENHEVVLANGGVPAESFIDYVGRSGFDNYDEYLDLVGADRLIPEMPFARISARRLLPANGLRGLPAIARRPLVAAPRKTAA